MGHSEWVPEHKVGDLQYGVVTFDVRDGKPCTWAFWMIRGATLVDIMSGIRAKRDINDWMSHGGVTSFTPPFAQVLTSFGHSYELSELTPEEIAVAKSELGL